jgi:segregation and condensation protein B
VAETGLVQIIEGALLAAGKPLTVTQLAELFEEAERPPKEDIRAALEEVAARCDDRGFELREVASGFRFQVRQNLGPWVARLWHERPPKYSRALLETLALIAYRQPITRGEIEEIRGVAVSSNIIKTLHEREWIRVVGHRDVPGRPAMYATTRQFLDYFNLKSLDQLPALAEIRDLETLNAELGFSEPLASAANDAAGSGEEGGAAVEPAAVDTAGGDGAVSGEELATPVEAGTDSDAAGADSSEADDDGCGADDDSSVDDSSEDAAGAQRADG